MTPVRSFGEFIQQALDDTGLFSATLVHDKKLLMDQVSTGGFIVVVLDLDLEPNPVGLIRSLNNFDEDLRIIAMQDNANRGEIELNGLKLAKFIDGIFSFPLFLDVLNTVVSDLPGLAISPLVVERGVTSFPSQLTRGKKTFFPRQAPEWLNDVERAAQYLTRLSLKSAAQAALISRKDQLWAYAGHLARPAADELALSVWHYWDRDGGSDLARFIRLKANDGEYMLYATGLGGNYVLALAFEIETPFSEMRTEANTLARRLKSPPRELPPFEFGATLPRKVSTQNRENLANNQAISHPIMENDKGLDQDLANGRQAFFEDLLSAVEIPDPDVVPSPISAKSVPDKEIIRDNTDDIDKDKRRPSRNKNLQESTPNNMNRIEMDNVMLGDLPHGFLSNQGNVDGGRFADDKIQESQKTPMEFEDYYPTTPSFHNLTYACILVPRMPKHRLVGDLVTSLHHWIKQLAVVSGWRLERLVIHPEYIHWVAALSPDIPPGEMIADLRQRLSKEIFGENPRLARENPSGDFWAPGFLIINGRDPLPEGMVDTYIEKTRSRQGVSRDQSPTPTH
jgi:REP element-mobilizing transposase RayT